MRANPLDQMVAMAACCLAFVCPPVWGDEGTAPAAEEDTSWTLQGAIKDTGVGKWLGDQRINLSGHVEAGITGNFDGPRDHQNFGRLFDDRANEPLLNQAVLTIERPLAPEEDKWDWGFKFQFMYGSDARFVHTLGWLDSVSDSIVQPDIVELFGSVHMPFLTKGGVDLKAGQFVTLQGAEVIYAPANPLYSHSYIFNFGIPLKHTGFLLTTHVTDQLDLCAGMVTGINTGTDDNNDAVSLHGGFTWRAKNEKVLVTGSVHYGPENDTAYKRPALGGVDANSDARTIGSMQLTLKPVEKLTLLTDLNYGREDGFDAEWYGAAQYGMYQLTDWLTFVIRGEIFRDDDGFAVFQFAENDDLIDAQRGEVDGLDRRTVGGGDSTYTALTLGVNWTPHKSLLVRPELRWDWAGGGNASFDDSSDNNQFTVAMDVIWKF